VVDLTKVVTPLLLSRENRRRCMKLIIQIPCWNEVESIGATISELPRKVDGFDQVEILVIDDGSEDGTAEAAKAAGADHVIQLRGHKGLAAAFSRGIKFCAANGADVIVNTDADNQYAASSIPDLVRPILDRGADFVIGARPIAEIQEFSLVKKILQRIGSWVVRQLSGTDVPDAPSGFRALTRETALRLNVFTPFSYTLETIIQAGRKGMILGDLSGR
jgi:glycosyltransferase involved in cell wall biosynthesis